jgi:hypothetical protein
MHALIIMNCQGSQNLGLHLGSRVDDVLEGKLVDQRHQVFTGQKTFPKYANRIEANYKFFFFFLGCVLQIGKI